MDFFARRDVCTFLGAHMKIVFRIEMSVLCSHELTSVDNSSRVSLNAKSDSHVSESIRFKT